MKGNEDFKTSYLTIPFTEKKTVSDPINLLPKGQVSDAGN